MTDEALVEYVGDDGAVAVIERPSQAPALVSDPYVGVSAVPFDEKAQKVLAEHERVPDEWIDIRPEGLLYLAHMKARHVLNVAFGFGGWAIVPFGEFMKEEKGDHITLYRQYRLYVNGRFVGETVAAGDYWKNNAQQNYADATEACQSYALNRLAKNFGIAAQCWDKQYGEQWKRKYAETYTDNGKTRWRKKSAAGDGKPTAARPEEATDEVTHQEAPHSAPTPSPEHAAPAAKGKMADVMLAEGGKAWIYQGVANKAYKDAGGKSWKAVGKETIATCDKAVEYSVMLAVEYIDERRDGRTFKTIVSAEPLQP